jgi:hypothetical protein
MGRLFKATPRPLYPQEAGWTPWPDWAAVENLASTGLENFLILPEIEPRYHICPALSVFTEVTELSQLAHCPVDFRLTGNVGVAL